MAQTEPRRQQALRLALAGGAPLTPRTAASEEVVRSLPVEPGTRGAGGDGQAVPAAGEDVRVETPRALRYQQVLWCFVLNPQRRPPYSKTIF